MRGRGVVVVSLLLAGLLLGIGSASMATERNTALDVFDWDGTGPLPEGVHELSHNWWVPYMDTAALNIAKGIRPGAWINLGNSYCTMSFVLTDPAGNLYITTSGHCTQSVGQRAFVKQDTPLAAAGEWLDFGSVVARWPSNLDAALIRIDADKHDLVEATMPGWGGPTGIATTRPDNALHYGWGWVTWQEHQTRCRPATTVSWGPSVWWIETKTYGGGGDSGSGVMSYDGLAMGILNWATNIQPDPIGGAFYSDTLGGLRMDVAMNALSAQSGLQLSLVTGGDTAILSLPDPVGDECHRELPVG